jgi:sortase A
VRIAALRRIQKGAQRALFACGILLLAYCTIAAMDAWVFQWRESGILDHQLRAQSAASEASAQPVSATLPKGVPAVAPDGLIGRLEIPRLLLSAVVVEGNGEATLRRAVGHIPGTALPGGPGNVGLAGHRDTFFRPLKDLKISDEVQLSTLNGNFKYEVESLRVLKPGDVAVLASSAENVLTMVTCYPFYYVGPAPMRFVVRARQVSPQTLARAAVK